MFKLINQQHKGFILLFLSSLLASFYFIFYKYLISSLGSSTFITGLFLVGFIYSILSSLLFKKTFNINKDNLIVGVHFAIFAIIGNYANGRSLEHVSPSVTSLFLKTQFIFLIIAAYFLFKEKITYKLIIGTLISIIGAYILSVDNSFNTINLNKINGILWALVSAVSFTFITIVQKKYSKKISPPTVNSIRFLIAFTIMISINNNFSAIKELSTNTWLIISVATICGPIASRLLIMYALKYVEISYTPVFSMLTPVFAIIFGYIILNENFQNKELIAIGIIIVGILIPIVSKLREKNIKN